MNKPIDRFATNPSLTITEQIAFIIHSCLSHTTCFSDAKNVTIR